jgi:NCAIR mutase (PurE)-related protein
LTSSQNPAELVRLLTSFQQGHVGLEHVLNQIRETGTGFATPDATVDVDRHRRCGFPEVVYSPGKTSEAIVEIFQVLVHHGQDCLATRINVEQAGVIMAAFPQARHNAVARTVTIKVTSDSKPHGRVLVVTAGTSDRPVAEEAVETVRWMNCDVELIVDVGVAGPHRLVAQQHRLRSADVVVVVAGMEGALPSVVGGYVSCPVVGVPTSQGYGASFGGLSALLGMLNSCASNVTVVNIDSGFKAGYVAGLIAKRASDAGSVNA